MTLIERINSLKVAVAAKGEKLSSYHFLESELTEVVDELIATSGITDTQENRDMVIGDLLAGKVRLGGVRLGLGHCDHLLDPQYRTYRM